MQRTQRMPCCVTIMESGELVPFKVTPVASQLMGHMATYHRDVIKTKQTKTTMSPILNTPCQRKEIFYLVEALLHEGQ